MVYGWLVISCSLLAMALSSGTDVESSQRWLKHHASQYRGRWVAVPAGVLLGEVPKVKALYQQIGPQGRTPNTIIVKVLSEWLDRM
jgi:hypothetical protein